MNFKKGDKVICVGASNRQDYNEKGSGWKPGLVFTIRDVTGSYKGGICWGGYGGNGVYADYLKLYKDKIDDWQEELK